VRKRVAKIFGLLVFISKNAKRKQSTNGRILAHFGHYARKPFEFSLRGLSASIGLMKLSLLELKTPK
jgi:hypothetical protein